MNHPTVARALVRTASKLSSTAAILLALQAVALAQTTQITGTVRDPSGATVENARVAIIHLDSGVRRFAGTAPDGSYGVASLPPGAYKITIRKHGFRTVARLGVELAEKEAIHVDFDLQIGGMQEVVTIEGDASTINTEDATSGLLVRRDTARKLPINGRQFQGWIAFAPGVVSTPATQGEAGQFSANGQRPNANYFVVDGVSANSGVSGSGVPGNFSGGTLPSMTAIGSLHALASPPEVREIRIQTSTFNPEFGRMPGAQVQISTRSGSNDLHGEAMYATRNAGLNANDVFSNRAGLPRPAQPFHDVALSLGGPAIRNRTFFFASAEALRFRQPAAWRLPVPSLESRANAGNAKAILEAFPLPSQAISPLFGEATAQTSAPASLTTGSFRLDHALGSQGALFVRHSEAASANRTGSFQRNDARFRSRSFTTGWTTALTASTVNDARLNISRARVQSEWLPGSLDAATLAAFVMPGGPPQSVYGLSIIGLSPLIAGSNSASYQNQFQLSNTLAIGTGRHQIRAGIDYQRLTPSRDAGLTSAAAQYNSLADLIAGVEPSIVTTVAPGGSSLIETLSLFAQDTWAVHPRLNLTYGLRWEHIAPPASRNTVLTGVSIFPQPSRDNLDLPVILPSPSPIPTPNLQSSPNWSSRFGQFAPRIGLAYRLTPNGDFILRAGFGVFYDLGFASAVDPLNGSPFNSWRNTLALPSIDSASNVSYQFSPNLNVPYSIHSNVTLERGFGQRGVFSAGWVTSSGMRLLRREGQLDASTNYPRQLMATSHGESNYQSLQLQYRGTPLRGLEVLSSYTWAHSLDNGSWDSGLYLVTGQATDRGSSNFDVRHAASIGLSYALPRDWIIGSTIRSRTAFPFDVLVRENVFGLGFDNGPRPDLVSGVPVWIGKSLNPAAFALPHSGPQGTLGRNALRGDGLTQLDVALERRFALSERASLQFRAEVFNATNTPATADPVRILTNPLFGQRTASTSLMLGTGRPSSGLSPAFQPGGPRTTELSLTLTF